MLWLQEAGTSYILVDSEEFLLQALDMLRDGSDDGVIATGTEQSTHDGQEEIAILLFAVSRSATSAHGNLSEAGIAAVGLRKITVLLIHVFMIGYVPLPALRLLLNSTAAFASMNWNNGGKTSAKKLLQKQLDMRGLKGLSGAGICHFNVTEITGCGAWAWRDYFMQAGYSAPLPNSSLPWKVSTY